MPEHKNPDLIKVTEIFLIPSSFLVAALGTADTNLHRAGVSLLGLIISALWWISSHEALAEQKLLPDVPQHHPRRTRIFYFLPAFFTVGWLLSTIVHIWLSNQPLGKI